MCVHMCVCVCVCTRAHALVGEGVARKWTKLCLKLKLFQLCIMAFWKHAKYSSVFKKTLDFLAVQGTLKSLLQHHSSKASVLRHSAFFIVQLSYPYMTTGKTIALTWWTFVDNVMSLLSNMLSRLVITFLPKSKHLLVSWLQFRI